MKYFDAFSGYGGFSLGIQRAYGDSGDNQGQATDEKNLSRQRDSTSLEHDARRTESAECIGYSEIDKYASQVYSKHFPTHKPYGSITAIDASTLPDFDLFVGGVPCQAFSIAGKRGGFEDTRGTLIYDVLRIVKEKHPRIVLLENVKGLLSHDSGRTFKTIITSLAELGYAVEWQVLNAKNFGVPQNRERVFIIGHLGGFGGRKVFPIGLDGREDSGKGKPVFSTIRRTYPGNWNGDYVDTDTKYRQAQEIFSGLRIRRLTPTECERLMGLPDGWTEGVSDTQRYKLCGNGVVVNVVEEIIKKLASNHNE